MNFTAQHEQSTTVSEELSAEVPELGGISVSVGFTATKAVAGGKEFKQPGTENAVYSIKAYVLEREIICTTTVMEKVGNSQEYQVSYGESSVLKGEVLGQYDYERFRKERQWLDEEEAKQHDLLEL